MKVRIKFAKQGAMKFVGHLDIMRYFQKVMRRSDVDIAYSEGFSPHQKMSFAAPLGVGLTSRGEYFDIEVNSTESSKEMLRRMNETMVEGMEVIRYRLLPEDSKNAMSIVSEADYLVNFRKGKEPCSDLKNQFEQFMAQEQIEILKATKKSEVVVDIRPLIRSFEVRNDGIFLKLATGSENNLKPELVVDAFCEYLSVQRKPFDLLTERLELYGKNENGDPIPLEDFGVDLD